MFNLKPPAMKTKLFLISMMLFMLSSQFSFAVSAVDKVEEPNLPVLTKEQQQIRVKQIELRVKEIKAMDKSRLTVEERKALRKELFRIKKEMKGFTSGGVYLSVAAIVVIILVIILIL